METRKEICDRLGLKSATLASRLWEKSIGPTQLKIVKGQLVYLYDKKAVTKIEALFTGRIPGKRGRPKKEKKS